MTGQPAGGDDSARAALIAGVACYVLWGLSPLVYQPMGRIGADAGEIMGHRAVWGVLLAAGLVWLAGLMVGFGHGHAGERECRQAGENELRNG